MTFKETPCEVRRGLMTREKYSEITIHLENIHDLFIQPVVDPFSKKANFISGIEFIKSELISKSWGLDTKVRTTIFLSKENIEPNIANKTIDALQRYCQFQVRQNKRTMVALRRQALLALLLGILFLVSGLVLSQFLDKVTFLPPFLSALFGDGFVIAFWVILWRPVDFFLFELWPFWREDRVYKRMMMMEINVAEEPASA
jgi:hypothetical protein